MDTPAADWGRTDDHVALRGRAKGIWCDVPTGARQRAFDEGAIYGTDWLAQPDGHLEP